MTEHIAQCRYDADQRVKAGQNGTSVIFTAYAEGSAVSDPFLTPADARTFARGILALADEVDGGEVAEMSTVKVGDSVRVMTDGANFADVKAGDVFTVRGLDAADPGDIDAGGWIFRPTDVEKINDKPVIDMSKVVALDDSAPSRAALLEQAMDLMSGSQTYTATDLTELADYLAEEK
jgi:hypothetical protein